ncbi:MAG TPA: Ldh family oxidoreductase, partial [Chloroflexota bacterium]|nr:Ldh family oxidoreductase [Chloroflexota bacterium]
PEGWALDREGNPSTDARVRAKGGTFAPIAEYKGFGLALLLSLFTSVLAEGQFDDEQLEASRAGRQTNRSHWFMAFDVGRLVPREVFGARVREIAARVREAPRKTGVDALYVPGDMERGRARRQMAEGVAYEPFIVDDLRTLAAELGIAGP